MSIYPAGVEVLRSARLSVDQVYRYSLSRSWGEWDEKGGALPFVMLNPSTADAEQDDPTIRRCVGLARSLGYTGIFVINLFAFRTKSPEVLWRAEADGVDIVGPENDHTLQVILETAGYLGRPVVAAWGAAPKALGRVQQVLQLPGAENLHAFALSNSGAPRHPLYLPSESELSPWPGPTVEE